MSANWSIIPSPGWKCAGLKPVISVYLKPSFLNLISTKRTFQMTLNLVLIVHCLCLIFK